MTVISSRQHAIVARAKAAAAGDSDEVLLDGWHLIEEALDAKVPLALVACAAQPPLSAPTLARLSRSGASVVEVTARVMDALSPLRTPTGIVALLPRPAADPARLGQPAPALVVAAVSVQDPGNVGALVRSAAAGGATGVVLDAACADPWGWKALRASMGAAFHLPVVRGDLASLLRSAGPVTVTAAVPEGGTSMYDVDLTGATAFLLGGEGRGLDARALRAADVRISIPMHRHIESLNVAAAAAVLVYEAARQRRRG